MINWEVLCWDLLPIIDHLSDNEQVAISSIPLSAEWENDKLVWPYEKSGNFTVRSGYHKLHDMRIKPSIQHPHWSHSVNPAIWKLIWSIKAIPKVMHFLWRTCSNLLPTMANLFLKKIVKSPLCPICNEYPESVEHMLFLCPWVLGVWFGIPLSYKVNLEEIYTIDDCLLLVSTKLNVNQASRNEIWCWISFTLWIIWKARCEVIYEHVVPNPIGTIHRIDAAVSEFMGVMSSSMSTDRVSSSHMALDEVKWCAPDPDEIKINCDGACDSESKQAGIGVIARNYTGQVMSGSSLPTLSNSALIVEASAALEGLRLAKSLDFQNVVLEVDSEQLIFSVKNQKKDSFWEIYPLLKEIRRLQGQFKNCSWNLVKRGANAAADWLARQAKMRMDLGDWVLCPPSSLVRVLKNDGLPALPMI